MTYPPPSDSQPDPHRAARGSLGPDDGHAQSPHSGSGLQPPYEPLAGQQFTDPPPPGFGPQPRSKAGLIIGLCAAGFGVLLVVVILVMTLGQATPTTAAQRYIAAAEEGDLDALRSWTCEQFSSDIDVSSDEKEEAVALLIEFFVEHDFEFLDESIEKDEATVTVEVTGPEGNFTDEMKLVDEDGWKVC